MLLIIHLAVVLIFVALGVLFWNGKGAFLIAGYNTMPKTEKAKLDEKKLCRFMGKFMFVLAACWLVIASNEIFKTMVLLWVGLALFFAATLVGIIYANTGGRFKP